MKDNNKKTAQIYRNYKIDTILNFMEKSVRKALNNPHDIQAWMIIDGVITEMRKAGIPFDVVL